MASEDESPGKDWSSISPLPAREARRNEGSWKEMHQIWGFLIKVEEEGAQCTWDLLFNSQGCICYMGCLDMM